VENRPRQSFSQKMTIIFPLFNFFGEPGKTTDPGTLDAYSTFVAPIFTKDALRAVKPYLIAISYRCDFSGTIYHLRG
jgi:hypothetical protein